MAARAVRLVDTNDGHITVTINYDNATRVIASVTVAVKAGAAPVRFGLIKAGGTVVGAGTYQPGTTTTVPLPQSPPAQRVMFPTDEVLARKLTAFGYYVRPGV